MSTIKDRLPLALAGLGSLAFALIGTAAAPAEPGFVADPASIATFYEANVDGVLVSQTLYFLSTLLLLCFAGGLYALLRRSEKPAGQTAIVALGGAVAGAAMLLAAGAANMVAALRVEETGQIAPDIAAVLYDLSSIFYGLAAPMALAVLVLGVAVAVLRGAVALPTWLGAVSVPLGVALAIPPINHVAIIAFHFWVGIAGVAVLTHDVGRVRADAAAGAARSVTA